MKKIFFIGLALSFSFTNVNANPLVREVLKPKPQPRPVQPIKAGTGAMVGSAIGVATVKQVKKKSIVSSLLKFSGQSLAMAMVSSTMYTGQAKASSFEYNSSGAKFYEQGNLINIGVSCDASSDVYGDGYWGWNEYGWGIYLENSEKITTFEYSLDNKPEFTQNILNKCKIK